MERNPQFTIEAGIRVQSEQLAKYKKILKPEAYDRLERWALLSNSRDGIRDGYDIQRGTDLDMFVQNNLMLENNLYPESK
jgi:hypothetical protein